jgi:hypothetical protein
MAKDPNDRYRTAGELGAAALTATTQPGPGTAPARAARKPPAAAAISTALADESRARERDIRRPQPDPPLWEADLQGRGQATLRAIVSDPSYGAAALSSSQAMSKLLKDLLPDMEREATVLIAAAEAGLADALQDHLAAGMDLDTATAQAAKSFAVRTGFRLEACHWAVGAYTAALGLDLGAS